MTRLSGVDCIYELKCIFAESIFYFLSRLAMFEVYIVDRVNILYIVPFIRSNYILKGINNKINHMYINVVDSQ